jgi:uncharacterized PurR-regulated membrane protein YhhQ (DUF165 family)
MDMICKRFGGKAAAKISILAMAVNLAVCGVLKLMSLTPGMWGEFYTTGSTEVNDALNATIGGSWYVVLGSSVAMVCAAITNSGLNMSIARRLKTRGYKAFAARSFISTGIAQFVDNFVFATIVSVHFFGWTWTQVIFCSLTGAVMELLCEVIFSPVGYKVTKIWEHEKVGEQYLRYRAGADLIVGEGM